ncbi:hypothetical protein F5Y16DRAFT_70627 [Xylariaceae sp. FL0255]|nr:hypothetical protein F5Y16DRAFT_70627 [Xylariaceae sp. FL0255]
MGLAAAVWSLFASIGLIFTLARVSHIGDLLFPKFSIPWKERYNTYTCGHLRRSDLPRRAGQIGARFFLFCPHLYLPRFLELNNSCHRYLFSWGRIFIFLTKI